MRVEIRIEIEVERISGRFASREEIEEALQEEVTSADPGNLSGLGSEGDSEYEVTSWDVTAVEPPKPVRRPRKVG